jgi:CO/xanthine dehydrogenase Mo-binding subunit
LTQRASRRDGLHGMGLGFARYSNEAAYAAVVVEVEAGETIKVVRAVAAVDCGRTINPDGVRNQVEGGIVQATSWVLKEQVRFDRTRITTRTWDDYPILRFSEAPAVEVSIIDRPDEPSLGVGEAVAGPVAAAIANAVFDAIGVRVRDLPFTRERMLAAINDA